MGNGSLMLGLGSRRRGRGLDRRWTRPLEVRQIRWWEFADPPWQALRTGRALEWEKVGFSAETT
jgi:hypothetical protein